MWRAFIGRQVYVLDVHSATLRGFLSDSQASRGKRRDVEIFSVPYNFRFSNDAIFISFFLSTKNNILLNFIIYEIIKLKNLTLKKIMKNCFFDLKKTLCHFCSFLLNFTGSKLLKKKFYCFYFFSVRRFKLYTDISRSNSTYNFSKYIIIFTCIQKNNRTTELESESD